MATSGDAAWQQDEDFRQAHELYMKAYSIIPATPTGDPSAEVLTLLRAASQAWTRHLEREPTATLLD